MKQIVIKISDPMYEMFSTVLLYRKDRKTFSKGLLEKTFTEIFDAIKKNEREITIE